MGGVAVADTSKRLQTRKGVLRFFGVPQVKNAACGAKMVTAALEQHHPRSSMETWTRNPRSPHERPRQYHRCGQNSSERRKRQRLPVQLTLLLLERAFRRTR